VATEDALSVGLSDLAALLLTEQTPASMLQRVVTLAAQLLPGADAASITIAEPDGVPYTASSTQDRIAGLDAEQYRLGEGPCLSALRDRAISQIDSMEDEGRWEHFCPLASVAGVKSMLCIPLAVDGTIGAINLYARHPYAFKELDRSMAKLFAGQVAVATQNAMTYATADPLRSAMAERLQYAFQAQDTIDQAVALLADRDDMTPEQAVEWIRKTSEGRNVRLEDVARDLLGSRLDSLP
jgi:GAF domain-containing protein